MVELTSRRLVREIMTAGAITIAGDTPVKDAAKIMSGSNIGALPVVDAEGGLIGLVAEGDLIMEDIKFHFPTYVQLLDGYIYFGSLGKFERELRKAVGAKVADVMTTEVVTVEAGDTVEDAATVMAERDISRLPVLEEGKLVGIITKGDIVRAISRS